VDIRVAPEMVDFDIKHFRVTRRVQLGRGKHIKAVEIVLTVRSTGDISGAQTRPATLVGMQNGMEVFRETKDISTDFKHGKTRFKWFHSGRLKFGKLGRLEFGPYEPTASGDIFWTVTIADDDPDDDAATAITRVEPAPKPKKKGHKKSEPKKSEPKKPLKK
jgi:hypothetical protein